MLAVVAIERSLSGVGMTVEDVLAKLEPLQRRAVQLVYFEGRSYAEAARVLRVERAVIAAAVVVSLRRVARYLRDEQDDECGGPRRGGR